jgi:heptosyltransferase-3
VPDAAPFKRALVIKLRHHGDVLLTTPVFATLSAHGVEADALVYDDTASMLSFNPDVSAIHCIGRQWRTLPASTKLSYYRSLYRSLADRAYECIVHLTDHWHGAWLARLLAPRIAVAPAVARSGPLAGRLWQRSFSCCYPVLGGNRRHTVEIHLDALRRIGIAPSSASKALRFVPGDAAEAMIGETLARHGIERGRYIAIHPTSRWLFKTWSLAGMAQLIDMLTARGEQVVLSAAPTPDERAWIAALSSRLTRPVVDLCGQLDLKQLGALIGGARAFVGVDSVPMHLAAALGIPTVALFGPSGDIEWGPWQVPHRVVTTAYSCRPCGQDGCGGSKVSDCLMAISAPQVLAALDSLLRDTAR